MRFTARLLGVVLAIAFLAASALPAWAGERPQHGPRRSISVQGLGVVTARPDMAVLHAGVTSQAPSAKAALSEHNNIMSNLLVTLTKFGLAERDIQSRQADLRAIYPNRGQPDAMPAPIAFRATGTVRIRLRQIDRLGDLLDRMTAAGVNNLSGLRFAIAEPAPLRDEARKRAVQDARRRAQLYAAEAGVQLGPVLQISEGGAVGPRPEFRALAASNAGGALTPGESEISVAVNVVFAIK